MAAIERDELEMMMDPNRERVIAETLFCAECGYQLRMLPFIGRCPECGNAYNARSRHRKGIFVPELAEFPATDILAALASTAGSLWLGAGLLS